VMAQRLCDPSCLRHLFKRTISTIVIEVVDALGQTMRSAEHSQPFPLASRRAAWLRKLLEIQAGVGGNEQIELAIAVIIDECAAGAPGAVAGYTRNFCDLLKGPVMAVAVEPVCPKGGYKEVGPAIIIYVADAHALAPTAGPSQSCTHGNVCKRAVVIVVVE